MKKDEILDLSRKENQNKDLVRIQIENKAVKFAALGIVIFATIYFCLEIFIEGKTNYGWYSIISLYCAIFFSYKGLKDHKKINIFAGLIWTLCTIGFVCSYLSEIFKGAL